MENQIKEENVCHDCGTNINIKDQEIENGVYLSYDNNDSI